MLGTIAVPIESERFGKKYLNMAYIATIETSGWSPSTFVIASTSTSSISTPRMSLVSTYFYSSVVTTFLLFLNPESIMSVVLHQLKGSTVVHIMPHGFVELTKWSIVSLFLFLKCWEVGRDVSPLSTNLAPFNVEAN
jgi:hypothetical protein